MGAGHLQIEAGQTCLGNVRKHVQRLEKGLSMSNPVGNIAGVSWPTVPFCREWLSLAKIS